MRHALLQPRTGQEQRGERGAALLVVLVFSALLAGIAGVALQSATSGARAALLFRDEMQADDLGRRAADAVAFQIVSGGPPAQRGGAFTLHLDGADMDVDYRSESARVDLNKAPAALVLAVLAAAGAVSTQLSAVQADLEARRGAGQPGLVHPGASPDQATPVAEPDRPGLPRAGEREAPAHPYELPLAALAAWHLPSDVARRALPALTVANGTAKVDPVLADRLVLSALMGGDAARVDDYVERRERGFVEAGSATALLPIEAQANVGFADVSAVRALVLVTVGHRFKRRYEIVLDPPAFPGDSPKVLSWRPLF